MDTRRARNQQRGDAELLRQWLFYVFRVSLLFFLAFFFFTFLPFSDIADQVSM
jgi:hypothetical protein